MFYRNKNIYLTVFIMLNLLVGLNSAHASWWDVSSWNKGLPVPADSQEVKREERVIAGNKFDFVYYASKSDIEVIKNFYRVKLKSTGWNELELLRELKAIPGIKIDNLEMAQTLEKNLTFSKDEEQIIISFLPRQYSKDNLTKFTVSYGKIAKNLNDAQAADSLPRLIAKPKKEVAPDFPGASLITLSEGPKTLKASYSVKSDIEPVVNFYRENMHRYGWVLVNEKPIEKRIAGGTSELGLESCPTCKNSLSAGNAAIELRFAELDFSNQAQDRCNIMISNAGGGPQGNLSITTILVDYEEKK